MILVSACLMGDRCRYDGKICKNPNVIDFLKDKDYIKICPEVMGGLDTPRIPAEIIKKKVINYCNQDVTNEFLKGANSTLEIAKVNNVKMAILKSKSPSCGSGLIYDGTFTGRLISGNGITAKLLLDNKIVVINENEINN